MRTKKTGRAVAKATVTNGGTPKPSHQNQPADVKSPAQLQLTTVDTDNLRQYLDAHDRPFNIAIAPAEAPSGTTPISKKRKRQSGLAIKNHWSLQDDLWEDRLSVRYEVQPRERWESLRRYKKFTVGDESIATGQCILVKHDNAAEDQRIDVRAQWKAKVLEVRALDQEHVYLRLAWLNRPEDLAGGRKPHHGKLELIPTNQLDVIDAMAVNGTVEVLKWNDDDDDSPMLAEDQFFWRQTYDFANTSTFMPPKLRQICIDKAPQNPDEMILQCSNEDCRQWLHVKCIAERAVQDAYDEANPKSAAKSKTTIQKVLSPAATVLTAVKRELRELTLSDSSLAQARAQKGEFTSEVYIKGLPDSTPLPDPSFEQISVTPKDNNATETIMPSSPPSVSVLKEEKKPIDAKILPIVPLMVKSITAAEANQIIITKPDGSKDVKDLSCLFCGKAIED